MAFSSRVGFVLYAVLLCYVECQELHGEECVSFNNQPGICGNIYSCKVVTDLLSKGPVTDEIRNFVKSLQCAFKNNVPYICCPRGTSRVFNPKKNVEVPPEEEEEEETEKFLLPPECGLSNATLPKVVGGVPAKLGEFPWIVALGYRNKKNPNQPKWLCGGSLITHKHVLTAAHCVYNRPDLYIARVGELDLYDDNDGAHPTDIQISEAKVHEEYNAAAASSDIALLTLASSTENLSSVWPICLPWEPDKRKRSYLGHQPIVAGWGKIDYNGPSSPYLQLTSIPVIENSNCADAYTVKKAVIDERIICAGYPQGGKDACQGDSGGPLMYGTVQRQEKGIRFYLIGVVSYGIRCAEAGLPGVYTRVTQFLSWISKNIK